MSKITITATGNMVAVNAPYNSEFISAAKRLGGRWNAPEWVFDARDEARVRALLIECYGTDGEVADLVTIRIEWTENESAKRASIEANGRTIARADGRDSGARLGDGVVLLDGEFGSGGSRANWTTTARAGTVVLVRDFPRAAAEALVAAPGRGRQYSIEPEAPEAPVVDADALRAERERLVARIAEIDALLA